jgi:predicted GIY-YIG superfamily endonuclease
LSCGLGLETSAKHRSLGPRRRLDREKQLKKWRRSKKDALVESMNPEWRDLWPEVGW